MDTNEINGHTENNNGGAPQVEPQPQSVHAVKNQPGTIERRTLIVLAVGVLISLVGVLVAIYTTKQQIEDARDALRLDQRAWLGYERSGIQARANDDESGWKTREPEEGDQVRGRLSLQNTGKTPAFNVRYMSTPPELTAVGAIPDEPEQWVPVGGTFVFFPNAEGFIQNTAVRTSRMSKDESSMYSSGESQIFFWAKLYYCDTAGHLHWTQAGVAHLSGASEYMLLASSVSPDPGEPNHEDCQNLGTPNP